MTLTAAQRRLRGRMGGLATAAKHDSRETSAPGRAAFLARFEREVDPDGLLPKEERTRRAEAARKAYFTRLRFRQSTAKSGRGWSKGGSPGS